jgi:hypothetical protein
MLRRSVCTVLALIVGAASVSAGEMTGKFVRFDTARKELTVNINGAETKYTLTDDVKVTTGKGEPTKKGIMSFANPRVAKEGAVLTVITSKKGDADVVTEIKLGGKAKQ